MSKEKEKRERRIDKWINCCLEGPIKGCEDYCDVFKKCKEYTEGGGRFGK